VLEKEQPLIASEWLADLLQCKCFLEPAGVWETLRTDTFFAGEGGDQLTGRCVCGLPITEEEFAVLRVLPPHFSEETLLTLQRDNWMNIIPGTMNILF
jgi:hypothetical protein